FASPSALVGVLATTPTMVSQSGARLDCLMRRPIASWFGKSVSANVWLTTTAGAPRSTSPRVIARPRTIGMRIVWKYSPEIARNNAIGGAAPPSGGRPSIVTALPKQAPPSGRHVDAAAALTPGTVERRSRIAWFTATAARRVG